MAKVAVLMRILPEDASTKPETLLEKIKEKLPEKYHVAQYQAEPIAFGLEALRVIILMPEDVEGGTNELEEIISSIEGISQVDVLNVARMME